MSKNKSHSGINQDEINEMVESKAVIKDASIPSQLLIVVTDEYANVRKFPTHIAMQERRVIKGSKLSFDDLVTGEILLGSDKWYKVEDGYIHESQVVEINEVIFK